MIWYLVRVFLAIVTVVVVCRFVGITWNDVDYFISNGLREAARILSLLRDAANHPLG